MKKKEKIISVRITTQVADILNLVCQRRNISKSTILSELITERYNFENNFKFLTPLERLLWKIQHFVDCFHNESSKTTTPCIVVADEKIDGDYLGKEQLLVGDDTCIREKEGKFYILDFHDEDAEIELYNEQEILDFYEGKDVAYSIPSSLDFSHQYLKGYFSVAEYLMNELEVYLKNGTNEHIKLIDN